MARLKEACVRADQCEISKPNPLNHRTWWRSRAWRQTAIGLGASCRPTTQYNITSGAENSYTVTMKTQNLAELKTRAVAQAIETIRTRIDALGVNEPVIQEHGLGQYQILVQLPGVDDPARVKEIMQSTAMLEIKQSIDGQAEYPSEQAALQAHGRRQRWRASSACLRMRCCCRAGASAHDGTLKAASPGM